VTEFSAAEERRQWSSLEHGVVDARRPGDVERTTRRVRSYEDRGYLRELVETLSWKTSVANM